MAARKDDEQEMSMDEILASIRKYVTEENDTVSPPSDEDEILDLKHVGSSIIDRSPHARPISSGSGTTNPPVPTRTPVQIQPTHRGPTSNSRQYTDAGSAVASHTAHQNTGAPSSYQIHDEKASLTPVHSPIERHTQHEHHVSTPSRAAPEMQPPAPVSSVLTSGKAMTASAQALSRLVETAKSAKHAEQLAASSPTFNQGLHTTLEALAVQAMTPMVKAWLDTHLPPVVEVLVQKEIQRITKELLQK